MTLSCVCAHCRLQESQGVPAKNVSSIVLCDADAGSALLEYAQSKRVDVMVCGSRGVGSGMVRSVRFMDIPFHVPSH